MTYLTPPTKHERKVCSCCGATLRNHRHALTLAMIDGLRSLIRAGGGPINLRELRLSRNTWDNFQKLRYWGLVENVERGVWRVTPLGREFVSGAVKLPPAVWTFRGKTVEYEGDPVLIGDISTLFQKTF